jgi:uncharacterized protein with HEPN domain
LDSKTVDAVIRQLTVIGEASNHVPDEVQEHFSTIPWQDLIALRNFVIHEYFGITLRAIWDTAKEGLPPIEIELYKIVSQGQDTFKSIVVRKKRRSDGRMRKVLKKK